MSSGTSLWTWTPTPDAPSSWRITDDVEPDRRNRTCAFRITFSAKDAAGFCVTIRMKEYLMENCVDFVNAMNLIDVHPDFHYANIRANELGKC